MSKEIALGFSSRDWQVPLFIQRTRFRVTVIHRRAGKALDVATPIPMANGSWKTMGDLVDGDVVLDEQGKPCNVVKAHEVMLDRPCYKVVFDDGSEVVCDEDHLWYTETKDDRTHRVGRNVNGATVAERVGGQVRRKGTVKKTSEILATLKSRGENNHAIPMCGQIQYSTRELHIDPYILGLWLGDGTSRIAQFTTMDSEILESLTKYAHDTGRKIRRIASENSGKASTYGISGVERRSNNLSCNLRTLDLIQNKHIPFDYLHASVEQRIALLQGLMDTDGSIDPRNGRTCEITQKSTALADAIMELLYGLGEKPYRVIKVVKGCEYHRITFCPGFNPFRLTRKASVWKEPKPTAFGRMRRIVQVEAVESRPVRCITVDSENSLYLCSRAMIPTHNTVFFVMHTIDEALRAKKANSRYAYICPFRKQAKDIAWDYFKRYVRNIPGVEIREADLQINLPNGSRISLYGADNIDAMRGLYFDGAVLDEAAQITQDAWESVIYPTLTDRTGWAEIGGTPKGINFLSERYEYAKNSGDPDWSYVVKNVYETGVFTQDEIEKMRRTIRRTFSQEYLCDFNSSADNALIQLDQCYVSAKRTTQPLDNEPKIIGVDVGRQGDDPSVICRRHGGVVYPLEVIHEDDLMRLAARVMHHIEDWSPDAVFVDATGGYGSSLVDRLRQLKHTVIGVQFAGSADSHDRYKNKRAEMYFKMCDDIISHVRLPDDNELFRELTAVTYKYSSSDQLLLESKDHIKTRLGGQSTDRADALALTWAYPVKSNSYPRAMKNVLRQLALASARGDEDSLWGDYS